MVNDPDLHRDVFICFSKARPGEAKVAFALKHELEQLGLFAFEYEHWSWVAAGVPDDEPEVDRNILRKMLSTSSVVVLISPHKGDPTAGVKTEIEELRSCGSPVILLHWSPEGWHPLLDPPELEGLNLVWSYSGTTSGDQDVAQNQCEHIARQLAVGSWLACKLRWLQDEHPRTGARLLAMLPVGPYDPLLNFRLYRSGEEPIDYDEPGDIDPLAADVVAEADIADLTSYVHDWRVGVDLLAETISKEAQFSLIRPTRTFYTACDLLYQHACRRIPELEQLPGNTLRLRGIMLTRLNRGGEAVEVLQSALANTPEDARWEVYQALALAQEDSDREAAIVSMSRAIESAPDIQTRCSLSYNRGVIRMNKPGERVGAEDDFTYALDHSTSSTMRHSALRARARFYTEQQNYDAAIADYTHVLDDAEATPRTAVSAWLDRGGLYREQGHHAKAIADWTRAITAADANQLQRFRALEARAQAFEETGQPQAAAADYEAMTRDYSLDRDYHEELLQKIAQLRS